MQEDRQADLQAARDYILQGLLGELLVLTATPEDVLVRRVRNYIANHLAEPIRLDDIFGSTGWS